MTLSLIWEGIAVGDVVSVTVSTLVAVPILSNIVGLNSQIKESATNLAKPIDVKPLEWYRALPGKPGPAPFY